MAVLGFYCCVGFSLAAEWGLLFLAVCKLLIVVASLGYMDFSSWGA